MGYNAKEQVAALDYDFAPYAPEVKGVTPEPPSELIKQYWTGVGAYLRRNRDAMQDWNKRLGDLAEDDSAARQALDDEFAAWQDENADKTRETRVRLLAMACSDQPSVQDLTGLPGRVFDNFEAYMQEELGPLGSRNGSN